MSGVRCQVSAAFPAVELPKSQTCKRRRCALPSYAPAATGLGLWERGMLDSGHFGFLFKCSKCAGIPPWTIGFTGILQSGFGQRNASLPLGTFSPSASATPLIAFASSMLITHSSILTIAVQSFRRPFWRTKRAAQTSSSPKSGAFPAVLESHRPVRDVGARYPWHLTPDTWHLTPVPKCRSTERTRTGAASYSRPAPHSSFCIRSRSPEVPH